MSALPDFWKRAGDSGGDKTHAMNKLWQMVTEKRPVGSGRDQFEDYAPRQGIARLTYHAVGNVRLRPLRLLLAST